MPYYPSFIRRFTALSSVFTALSLGLSAQDITLRISCWEGYAPDAEVAKFEQAMTAKHGVAVKVVRKYVSTPEDFFQALREDKADVVSPSHNTPLNKKFPLFPLAHALNLASIPNYAKINPSLQRLEFHTAGDKVYAAPILYGPYALVYDQSQVPVAPTSWKALLDSAVQGKYTLCSDYPEVNVYTAALIAGIAPADFANFNKVNTPAVREILGKLAKGAKGLWAAVDKPEDFAGCTLGTSWGFALPALNEQGKPWAMAKPVEGTTAYVDSFMIAKAAEKNPRLLAIAEAWVDYALSEEMQVTYMRSIGVFPSSTLVLSKATPAEVEKYALNKPTFFRDSYILWPVLDERASNGYAQLWEAAKK